MKYFVILFIIIGGIMLVVSYAFKKLRNVLSFFTPVNEIKREQEKDDEEVVYRKNNVVVMKGDAGKPKE